jgi:hypothetical protein
LKYSAGINKNSFWLTELVSIARMRDDEKDWSEIKHDVTDENILLASSTARAKQMYGVLNRRLNSLPNSLTSLLVVADLDSQKMINLVAIMNTELLVKDFVLERFRDELILGDSKIEPYEIQSFFDKLQANHDAIAGWTDQTIHRLTGTLKNYLKMAGIAVADGENLLVQRPLLTMSLETTLRKEGYSAYVSALTGM